jgi:predicted 3-demethylubiquinone-9 3-methyltransferase (glyoxalase superfamily)
MANPNQKNYPQMRTNMTTSSPPKNRIRLWFDSDALAATKYYMQTFLNSTVGAVHLAPPDNPSTKDGPVLTFEFMVMGIPCLGFNSGPKALHTVAVDDAEHSGTRGGTGVRRP